MLKAAKFSRRNWWNFQGKIKEVKTFEGERLLGTSSSTLLEIFCKTIPKSIVIIKGFIDPEDNL